MLKVCFDLSAAIAQSGGISRYEAQLATELVRQNGPEAYSFFYTHPRPLAHTRLPVELARLPHRSATIGNKRWRAVLFAKHLLKQNCDQQVFTPSGERSLFHGMDNIAPPLHASSVITLFDLSFLLYPQLHSRLNRTYLEQIVPICARKARRIIVISENTRRDLLDWLGPELDERIRVTPLGVFDLSAFEDLTPAQLQNQLNVYDLVEQSYILSVGTIEPRKNQARLVAAYAQLLKKLEPNMPQPSLVLVGRIGWGGEYERIKATAFAEGLKFSQDTDTSGQVRLLTNIGDPALKALYQGASITSYCSQYEGFGLPALEAMAAGTPLVTANNSSLPEVTGPSGETALLVNVDSTHELVQALQTLWTDRQFAQRLKQAARSRARKFTWQRTAELTHNIYQEIS